MRAFLLVFVAACAPTTRPTHASVDVAPVVLPPATSSAPTSAPTSTGTPPAGLYAVREHVVVDTCHPARGLPPEVTVLVSHRDANIPQWNGMPHWSVPVPRFGSNPPTERVVIIPGGSKGGGMSHPKKCPGTQETYEQTLDVTANGFRLKATYEMADGWDCPNPRPAALCRTELVYDYTLVSAACESRCDSITPGRDADVPVGPVPLACRCN